MEYLASDKLTDSLISIKKRHALAPFETTLTLCYGPREAKHKGACVLNEECRNWANLRERSTTCKGRCGNRRIATGIGTEALKTAPAGKKGIKLMTTKDIYEDSLVLEYAGVIKRDEEYRKDCDENPGRKMYGLKLVDGWIIDATTNGNLSRYINHDCCPNLRIERWASDDGTPRMMLVSDRFIPANRELTFDYNPEMVDGRKFPCKCNRSWCLYKEKRTKEPSSPPLHKCPTCNRILSRQSALKRHLRTHDNQVKGSWECGVCGRSFKRDDDRRRHERTHLARERKFRCDVCGRCFLEQAYLQRHIRVFHSGVRQAWACEMRRKNGRKCEKLFYSKSGLDAHTLKCHRPPPLKV